MAETEKFKAEELHLERAFLLYTNVADATGEKATWKAQASPLLLLNPQMPPSKCDQTLITTSNPISKEY